MSDQKKIRVELDIRRTIEIDVDVTTILEAIEEMPLLERYNAIANLLNSIEMENSDDLKPEQKTLIYNWLKRQLIKFK